MKRGNQINCRFDIHLMRAADGTSTYFLDRVGYALKNDNLLSFDLKFSLRHAVSKATLINEERKV